MTQTERVKRFIERNPGCTTMQIQLGCQPFISNPRARISDLRAQGINVVCRKRRDGLEGFTIDKTRPVDRVVEAPALFGADA
jgi:hypothetical protein